MSSSHARADPAERYCIANFSRYGARSLLLAKFIPGLGTAAPPLAGIFGMRLSQFLLFDGSGTLLWAGVFAGLGYLFSGQLEHVAEYVMGTGSWLVLLMGGCLVVYLAWKYTRRQRFLRQLSVARITPEELKEKLDAGEEVMIVDLRHSHDFATEPSTIPQALRMSLEDMDQRYREVPLDRDVVLYCT